MACNKCFLSKSEKIYKLFMEYKWANGGSGTLGYFMTSMLKEFNDKCRECKSWDTTCEKCFLDKAAKIYKLFKEYRRGNDLINIDQFLEANMLKTLNEKCEECK